MFFSDASDFINVLEENCTIETIDEKYFVLSDIHLTLDL